MRNKTLVSKWLSKDMKVMSCHNHVSTVFEVHYNQKLGGPTRPFWGGTHHGLWGDRRPCFSLHIRWLWYTYLVTHCHISWYPSCLQMPALSLSIHIVCRQHAVLIAVYRPTSAMSHFYTNMVWGLLMFESHTISNQLYAVVADYINAFVE